MITCVQDAHEERYVVRCDVHVVIDGDLVDILVRANAKYKKFVHITKQGKKIMYLKLRKALYGTLTAARLFWGNITDKLKRIGFELNEYDQCVANKEIDGSQCTIVWLVDDLKISHKSNEVAHKILKYLNDIYGELSVTEGNKHTYVGMDIHYPGNKTVKFSMECYLKEALQEFPEQLEREVSTPAALHLFWKQLTRLLCYIKQTLDLKLTLAAENMSITKWWVDVAYGVHDDGKSQTGCSITFGHGTLSNKAAKQKINAKSLTAAELIVASDSLSQVIWTTQFLQKQGYNVDNATLFQDNKSAIILENNVDCLVEKQPNIFIFDISG